jgi:hypothetical protein
VFRKINRMVYLDKNRTMDNICTEEILVITECMEEKKKRMKTVKFSEIMRVVLLRIEHHNWPEGRSCFGQKHKHEKQVMMMMMMMSTLLLLMSDVN